MPSITSCVPFFSLWLTLIFHQCLVANPLQTDLEKTEKFVQTFCIDCHLGEAAEGDLDLDSLEFSETRLNDPDFDTEKWEKILRRLIAGQMPPPESARPTEQQYSDAICTMSALLEQRSKKFPRPGRTNSLRRLNRTEYRNAIRDLLSIDVDVDTLLPRDESSHGFDNVTVNELSPALMSRYLAAAEKISQVAIGSHLSTPGGVTIRLPADQTQEKHVEGLPLGTRGGILFNHHFPQTGQYEIELRLMRDRDEKVEGLNAEHQVDILIDRNRVQRFTVKPPRNRQDFTHSDSHLKTRIKVESGAHKVGVTFPVRFNSLLETKRQPFDARYNRHRHPRSTPALFQVSIVGPFDADGVGPTRTRQLVFSRYPEREEEEREAAEEILKTLLRRAYRRPVNEADLQTPLAFFEQGRAEDGFEAGIELALAAILVNPNFLFRIESQPAELAADEVYPISDVELASRLSFFLWSSLPDEELLTLAEQGRLQNEGVLKAQVKRMLADEKSQSLVNNFAAQWLYLRNLDSITPDLRLFPDFDDNLRQAFRGETEQLFQYVLRTDASVLDLIRSDFTFLNERLATHYGIPHIAGSDFRRIELPAGSPRGGLLRHGSILTVTSYATRTSPTIRGSWILENIFGTPPPPPPPNIPNLSEKSTLRVASVRERLALHRADPVCASCHRLMDPVGFGLENFDAVGRWREFEDTLPIDSSGTLPDGTKIDGVEDLEAAILRRPEAFVGTLTEKLLTFALGRGVEYFDGPAVRKIVRDSAANQYRFSAIIEGIVLSEPFQTRSAE